MHPFKDFPTYINVIYLDVYLYIFTVHYLYIFYSTLRLPRKQNCH